VIRSWSCAPARVRRRRPSAGGACAVVCRTTLARPVSSRSAMSRRFARPDTRSVFATSRRRPTGGTLQRARLDDSHDDQPVSLARLATQLSTRRAATATLGPPAVTAATGSSWMLAVVSTSFQDSPVLKYLARGCRRTSRPSSGRRAAAALRVIVADSDEGIAGCHEPLHCRQPKRFAASPARGWDALDTGRQRRVAVADPRVVVSGGTHFCCGRSRRRIDGSREMPSARVRRGRYCCSGEGQPEPRGIAALTPTHLRGQAVARHSRLVV
jgi:hypothetical protein